MLSQTVEYALRATVYLADHGSEARTTQQIAASTKVPAPYLSKVMQALVRAGLVASQRGVGGGFTLARSANELTIWDVVQAVEPITRYKTCPLGLAAHRGSLCPLHQRLDDAIAHLESAFQSTTLAEILGEPSESKPLCDFPRIALPLRS